VEEVGDLFGELVERTEEPGVKLVVLLKQLLDQRFPEPLRGDLRIFLAGGWGHAHVAEHALVNIAHVVGGLARLAVHRAPHLEFLDGLVQGDVHDELLRVLEKELARADREQRAVDVPAHHADFRERLDLRPGLDGLRRRRRRPHQVARVQKARVLFQRQRHAWASARIGGWFAAAILLERTVDV
jgi:hypothetical protein